MKNKEIADIFYEIAGFLEIKDVKWKPRAYRRAARSIETLSEDIEKIYREKRLEDIEGVGENIRDKIIEYLETGHLEYYEELKKDLPVDFDALTSIEGIGPKTVKKLYQELDVNDIEDLEEAARKGKIADLKGFGEKSEQNILKGLDMAKINQKRMLLGEAFPLVSDIKQRLSDSIYFDKIDVVGSFRRKKPTIGDIDILATSNNPEKAMEEFCNFEDVVEVLEKGKTKSSVIVSDGLEIDLRIIDNESWGSGLIYFTGSKDHNINLRRLSNRKSYKLNEYGLYRKEGEKEKIASVCEKDVYKALNLDYIPPELREDTGEVEAAEGGKLPKLVEIGDIRGDLHMHTNWSDGINSIEEMAKKAEKRGYNYIAITDHGPGAKITDPPQSISDWKKLKEEITRINEKYNLKVLFGAEAEIEKDGIDLVDEIVDMLDLLLVALHRKLSNPTEKLIDVFNRYPVGIWVHPLNRKINKREPLDLNLNKLVNKAKKENISLEINSQPHRLDLPWDLVKKHRNKIDYVINTDAHSVKQLDYLKFGIYQARRGWLEKENILNTRKLDNLQKILTK
ncbi:MAG: DNA polymerase IV (family X) POL4 [Candidatus Methanohalarchaeum thermophilum]|uniref:DNA polymerase beta n=1 Tax=Methanohalarchaeum thermophilum TaxID=1903181 RepID=A0A1Q6DSF1_METT1|nr:MAG: DNA polymerase IV (family X) POL4 [Candidatus Methanohalarchaeum thermophilum]